MEFQGDELKNVLLGDHTAKPTLRDDEDVADAERLEHVEKHFEWSGRSDLHWRNIERNLAIHKHRSGCNSLFDLMVQ